MSRSIFARGFLLSMTLVLVGTLSAYAWDGDKLGSLPDVPQPADCGSCWLVAAANAMGGAGWGAGATPDERGQSIYNQLAAHYPNGGCDGGYVPDAMNWWLKMYGCTGASPYYDVTIYETPKDQDGLTKTQYDFLIDELARCQYVAVSWGPNQTDSGHSIALGAGNKCYDTQSVWRDGNTATRDDVTNNAFPGDIWHINKLEAAFTVPPEWIARYAVTLCPGKPKWAMEQYDVLTHWNQGDLVAWNESGQYADVYTDPVWDSERDTLVIGNRRVEEWQKQLFIELTFTDPQDPSVLDLGSLIQVGSEDDVSVELRGQWHWYEGNSKALAKFLLKPQPNLERIVLPDQLRAVLDYVNVATYCIPEPSTFALLLLGAGMLTMIARKRRG